MAEDKYVGFVVVAALAVLVGLIIFQLAAANVNTLSQTATSTNVTSYTLAANGTTNDLTPCGQLNTSAVVIFNATNGTAGFAAQAPIIPASNYTIAQGTGTDGYLSTRLTYNSGGYPKSFAGAVQVTCDYEPYGYIHDSSASRSVAGLIVIIAALAIALAASPNLREWLGFDF